jgi:lysophospholipase L1-like esterase
MNHIVLLGDSIFDNRAYVRPGEPAVIEQLRSILPNSWKATLLALDGSTTTSVSFRIQSIPFDATHLVLSVGGNDALSYLDVLTDSAQSVAEVLSRFSAIQKEFEGNYLNMLDSVLEHKLPTALCTIYYPAYPEEDIQELTIAALSTFNDCIIRAAITNGLPLLDLRLICNEPSDYANPIEPSSAGGDKIASMIKKVINEHDFSQGRTTVYF